MKNITLLKSITAVFVLLIFACDEQPEKKLNPSSVHDYQRDERKLLNEDNLLIPGVIGFWPFIPPFSEMVEDWNSCVEATGTIVPDQLQYLSELRNTVKTAYNLGYQYIMWSGFHRDSMSTHIPLGLSDDSVGSFINCLYVDEPIYNNWTENEISELLANCDTFSVKIAISGWSVSQLEDFRAIVASERPSMLNNVIYMPDMYFNESPSTIESFYSQVKSWAQSKSIPLSRVFPWVAPSCEFPPSTGQNPASGCNENWTYDIICYLKNEGFGGIFFYIANGLDSDHSFAMEDGLSDCGWISANNDCGLVYDPHWEQP